MAESGGASTQHGIFYQNSIAALALLDLLELGNVPSRERVVEVRVESPNHVDDVVIRYADGHSQFQNVKSQVQPGSKPWVKLWQDIENQYKAPLFKAGDILSLVFELPISTSTGLRDICERANTSINESEWHARLTRPHKKLVSKIEESLVSDSLTFELLKHINVLIFSLDQVSDEFARRELSGCATSPQALLSTLRDIVGGKARKRAILRAPYLRNRLLAEHNIEILEPREWGVPAYHNTIARLANIEIPGTGISGSTNELFVWPRLRHFEKTNRSDFEDEFVYRGIEETGTVDLQSFPSSQLHKCIVVAGPGYGKSALLTAIAERLAHTPIVPVHIPLASFAASEVGVTDYLSNDVNRDFDVKVDWRRLAEHGLVALLFDGLDEVPMGKRNSLIGHIETFSARYPSVPWLLTVRDPAVLVGLSEAEILEITSLDDSDIERFMDKLKVRLPALSTDSFSTQLRAHPDLQRLARIPLFLSMLLAMSADSSQLPSNRADLIEAYLRTLFVPQEHKKALSDRSNSSNLLRNIAEDLAFERLEKQEIGASEREVMDCVLRVAPTSSDAEELTALLQENGILRKQSSIRLQFPFPTIQEYLAACYLVRHSADSLVNRIDDAVQRPWAQTIQFALELSDNPAPVIRKMLDRSDDTFCSGLRIVGRCIANGVEVDSSTFEEVRNRLVNYWLHAPTRARERVGSLLAEAFANPMSDSLRKAIHNYWLFNSGAGDIISQAKSTKLTLSVLKYVLDNDPDKFSYYHCLKPAISAAGDDAFSMIVERINDESGIEDDFSSILWHFSPGSVSSKLALSVAHDETLPDKLRLRAYHVAGPPLEAKALELLDDVLISGDNDASMVASDIFSIYESGKTLLLKYLRDSRLSEKSRLDLIGDIRDVIPTESERAVFLNQCLEDRTIDESLKKTIRVFAARYGNEAIFQDLVAELHTCQFELACETIMLFGHYPDRELAEYAADLVQVRIMSGSDICRMAHSVACGMLYIYEMDWLHCGVLKNTSAHPGLGKWLSVVEQWLERDDLTKLQRLDLLSDASRLGSINARSELLERVLCIKDPDDPEYSDKGDHGLSLSQSIDEARRFQPLLPLDLAESFVKANLSNVPQAGIRAIGAHSNRTALDLLIKLHSSISDWFVKDSLSNTIELMASKLGVFVEKNSISYVIN